MTAGLGASSVNVSADSPDKEGLAKSVTDTEAFNSLSKLLEKEYGVTVGLTKASVVSRKNDDTSIGLSMPLTTEDGKELDVPLNATVENDTVRLATRVNEEIHLASRETVNDFENGVYTVGLVEEENYLEKARKGTTEIDPIRGQSHALPYIGFAYNYVGTYDDDYVCDNFESAAALIGAVAFLLGNDISGVGVLDDLLVPFVVGAGAGCLTEDFVNDVLAGTLDCSNFLYEVYTAKWWVPIPQQLILIPIC